MKGDNHSGQKWLKASRNFLGNKESLLKLDRSWNRLASRQVVCRRSIYDILVHWKRTGWQLLTSRFSRDVVNLLWVLSICHLDCTRWRIQEHLYLLEMITMTSANFDFWNNFPFTFIFQFQADFTTVYIANFRWLAVLQSLRKIFEQMH